MKLDFKQLLFLTALSSSPAIAQQYVSNSGFETGDLTAWNFTPAASGSYAGLNLGSVSGNAGSANYFSFGGSAADTLSQTLSLPSPGTYDLDFFLNNSEAGVSGSNLTVSFGGTQVLNVPTSAGAFGWTEFSFQVSASSSTPTVSFAGQSGGLISLDDVTVTTASAVPEPGFWAVASGGLLLAFGAWRRVRR
jgi:hypothetical protein